MMLPTSEVDKIFEMHTFRPGTSLYAVYDHVTNNIVAMAGGDSETVKRIVQKLNELEPDGPICEWAVGVAAYTRRPRYTALPAIGIEGLNEHFRRRK